MRIAADPHADVDEAAAIDFFDARARRAPDAAGPGVTMLQDGNHGLAARRNDVEVDALHGVLDGLGVAEPRTLDVGCGAGRLQAALADRLGDYIGVDGAPALIAAARRAAAMRPAPTAATVRFAVHNLASPGLADLHTGRPPQLVLMSGILIYLNDGSVRRLLAELSALMSGPCTLVLREPVGVDARLTLQNHWSDELQAHYNAVYRTAGELQHLLDAAFGERIVEFDARWLYADAALNNRAETRQMLMVATLA